MVIACVVLSVFTLYSPSWDLGVCTLVSAAARCAGRAALARGPGRAVALAVARDVLQPLVRHFLTDTVFA